MIIGAVLAAGAAASGQASGAIGGIAIGVATPMIVERLTKLIPLRVAGYLLRLAGQLDLDHHTEQH
jgi:hypothetical protein